MAKINLQRRAEIGRKKRARTKAQLIAAARTLFSKKPWEAVTVDEVVNEAGVAKGTFYSHFNDSNELAAAVADEVIQLFDELMQLQRLSIADPLLRIAVVCYAFMEKALEDRPQALLVARMARSYPSVGEVARSRFSEDLCEALKLAPNRGLSQELALEVTLGAILQVGTAIGEGRLGYGDLPEAVRCLLTAIGVGNPKVDSVIAQVDSLRRIALHFASGTVHER